MAERRFNPLIALPPLLFIAFAVAAWFGLQREDPNALPSALIGKTTPPLAYVSEFPGSPTPTDADLTGPVAMVVGNEAHGVADDEPVDGWLTIPQAGAAESLNVAMAATVLAFEVARQRRLA